MKSNEEFLKGIYEKAEIINSEKKVYSRKPNRYLKYSSIAALFIIIPVLLIQGNLSKELPPDVKGPRVMSYGNIDQGFLEADQILSGTVVDKRIEETEIKISVDVNEVLYGSEAEENIIVYGAENISDSLVLEEEYIYLLYKQDKKLYLYNDIEGLLINDNSGSFIDVFGNRYTIEDILNNIDGRR